MIIIGKTENGFIVEMTKDEEAKIEGFRYCGSGGHVKPQVGDKIDINAIFNKVYNFNSLTDELQSTAESLRKVANRLGPISDKVQRVNDKL